MGSANLNGYNSDYSAAVDCMYIVHCTAQTRVERWPPSHKLVSKVLGLSKRIKVPAIQQNSSKKTTFQQINTLLLFQFELKGSVKREQPLLAYMYTSNMDTGQLHSHTYCTVLKSRHRVDLFKQLTVGGVEDLCVTILFIWTL